MIKIIGNRFWNLNRTGANFSMLMKLHQRTSLVGKPQTP